MLVLCVSTLNPCHVCLSAVVADFYCDEQRIATDGRLSHDINFSELARDRVSQFSRLFHAPART